MKDRLGELLESTDVLYTIVCRDATLTDVELLAQAGYHIVWLDLEHSAMSTTEALRLGRAITHLGMVPLARILELSRTHVQRLLDGGFQVVALPDIRSVEQARELVRLGKYPPLGERGASSNTAGIGFTLGSESGAHAARGQPGHPSDDDVRERRRFRAARCHRGSRRHRSVYHRAVRLVGRARSLRTGGPVVPCAKDRAHREGGPPGRQDDGDGAVEPRAGPPLLRSRCADLPTGSGRDAETPRPVRHHR